MASGSVLRLIVMPASTTNYLPLDSDAPSVFSLNLTINHVVGELRLSYITAHGLTSTRPVAFAVRSS
jgi:hypothetical protein